MKLGILMEGGEDQFISAIRCAMKNAHCAPSYLEIGVAYGETLKGVLDGTRDLSPTINGIELEEWAARHEIESRIAGEPLVKMFYGRSVDVLRATCPDSRVSCVLIDACHGKPCVMADFVAVEPYVAEGGIVMFHDAGRKEQGIDMQPHCNQPIGVRAAIDELGLWTNERDGWQYVGMIPTANQTAVFRKVKTISGESDTVPQ